MVILLAINCTCKYDIAKQLNIELEVKIFYYSFIRSPDNSVIDRKHEEVYQVS